jgi:hypothetical protein
MPRMSPKHDTLAFLRLDEDGESVALEVITLDGGADADRRTSGERRV